MKYIRLTVAILLLLALTGCSTMPFTTPEEQQAAQEALNAARLELQEQADPAQVQKDDLRFHKILTNSVGTALAEYRADLPYFSKTGQKSQSFQRINDYYLNEIAGLDQDAKSLFAAAQQFYGENWNTVTEATQTFAVKIDYELLDAPAGYLSVRCDYHLSQGGQQEDYSQAQVFLLDNGWRLTLQTLLGEDYAAAEPMLLASILDWCAENGIDVTAPETRTLSEFSEKYALTEEGFVFYTQSFQLNNKNANRYSVPVPIGPYRGMLERNS